MTPPKKTPKQRVNVPSSYKKPKRSAHSDSKERVQWSFASFDHYHWHADHHEGERFQDIASKLKAFEGMTWGQIKTSSHDHTVLTDGLCADAKKRLRQLNRLDDFLWRFRFTGTQRLWGSREGNIFQVLWWDPNHKICPSAKKRT